MDKLKINLPKQVNEIIKVLQEHGYEAYAVGGCVRDSALGRKPGIGAFLLLVVLEILLEQAEMIVQPYAVPV